MLYVFTVFAQMVVEPDIDPGWDGTVLTVIGNVLGVPEPQLLLATTDKVPPLEFAVVVILVVVEVPVQPDGSVHVYEVAPLTEEIE